VTDKQGFIAEDRLIMELLLQGKARYRWPPCTNYLGSGHLSIEIFISLFYQTSYLNEEVNCNEPSPPDTFPGFEDI